MLFASLQSGCVLLQVHINDLTDEGCAVRLGWAQSLGKWLSPKSPIGVSRVCLFSQPTCRLHAATTSLVTRGDRRKGQSSIRAGASIIGVCVWVGLEWRPYFAATLMRFLPRCSEGFTAGDTVGFLIHLPAPPPSKNKSKPFYSTGLLLYCELHVLDSVSVLGLPGAHLAGKGACNCVY